MPLLQNQIQNNSKRSPTALSKLFCFKHIGFISLFFLTLAFNIQGEAQGPGNISQYQPLSAGFTAGTDLIHRSQNIPYGSERDQFILGQLNQIRSFTADEVHSLAGLAARVGLEIVLNTLSKISPLLTADLVQIVSSLHLGTERDKALIAGAKLIKQADLPSIKTALKQAYNEKIQVMSLLVRKLPNFSTDDLASLAKDFSTGSMRDQILLVGSDFITVLNVPGLAEMVHQADSKKNQVALTVLPRIVLLSASNLGLILQFIDDGTQRDQLIAAALPLIKKVDGAGAGAIIERSVEQKAQLAMTLFKMITKATGTDLDQILAGCTLGTIRDQILDQAVPLLGSLTKEEAKALHSRAYNNKDKVALLLMAKVDDFDGVTIAEIARLSLKGSSRDLIITEGLKRLKVLDAPGLIALIGAADQLVEMLALEVVARIPNYSVENALAINAVILSDELKDRFLSRSVELIVDLDEPSITLLALAATTQAARTEIVQKGVARIGDDQ